MAAKKTAEAKRDRVVVCVMQRGLNTYHRFHGPFTAAEAASYANHGNTYGRNEAFHVESMTPLQHHEKWIVKDCVA